MAVKQERWQYGEGESVWVGKYKNSHNLPHWHYDCELIFADCGKVEVFCGDKAYRLNAGEALFIQSEQVHYMYDPEEGTVLSTVIFDFDIIKKELGEFQLENCLIKNGNGVLALYQRLMNELREKKPFYRDRLNATVRLFVLELFGSLPTVKKQALNTKDEKFKSLLEEINSGYSYYTLANAAEFMNMNASYFSRYFHKTSGMTFSLYLNHVRVAKAVELLREGKESVTEIAAKSGFETIRNFNRAFKSLTKYTPTTIPKNYVFQQLNLKERGETANPTLVDCELIECSPR